MKISRIVLNNIGSYLGENTFNIDTQKERNIVLIGGKNGAGKTTLFTAMRLCLYGYTSMGYKNANAFYTKSIIKLINNNEKMQKPATASVEMDISIPAGTEINNYTLIRKWVLNEDLKEEFIVYRDGVALNDELISDFEKYLTNIIPPELFNLYFFDGEAIADFFLDDGSNKRIREAFLTLSGYDTFAIMRNNFLRYSQTNNNHENIAAKYVDAQELYEKAKYELAELTNTYKKNEERIREIESELVLLEKTYKNTGGRTNEQWDALLDAQKNEEKRRDELNAWLKKTANDILPFLIVLEQIKAVKDQIASEDSIQKYYDFCEILDSDDIKGLAKSKNDILLMKKMDEKVKAFTHEAVAGILLLSPDDKVNVLSIISRIQKFDKKQIKDVKRKIKQSLKKSAEIRNQLETSNIDSVQTYMTQKAFLYETKSNLLNDQLLNESKLYEQSKDVELKLSSYNMEKSKLEECLKQESIADISSRAIIMLDRLQSDLYHQLISRVEKSFLKEIEVLIRKKHLIDDIKIDDDFNVHIFRNEDIPKVKIISALESNADFLTTITYSTICEQANSSNSSDVISYLNRSKKKEFSLPVEIDKTRLSNGEKQIFIMALYYALVSLCNHEIPFVIDTPFARIDSEHRDNIAKHFFSNLKGQVFILSTNEEITKRHINLMKTKLAGSYLLENIDNSCTQIVANSYFGE